jgi:hypothetical protein
MVDVPRKTQLDPAEAVLAQLQAMGVNASPMTWERGNLLPIEKSSAGDVRPAVPQVLLDLWDALTLPGDVFTGKVDPMSDEGIGRAAAFPAQISMPGLAAGSAQALNAGLDPNMLNVFIGPKGAQRMGPWGDLHPDNFLIADEAYRKLNYRPSNEDVQAIFRDTSVFPGKDGKPRMEVPDYPELDALFPDVDMAFQRALARERGDKPITADPNNPFDKLDLIGSTMVAKAKMPTLKASGNMEHMIYHPQLWEAYPELRGLQTDIQAHPNNRQAGAYWIDPDTKQPRLEAAGGTNADVISVLLHELQHAVQRAEGYSTGGNPDHTKNIIAGVAPYADQQLEIASPYMLYRALAGETEARNVQTRYELGTAIGLPFAESPLHTEDIPRHLQILSNQLWAPNPKEYPVQNAQMIEFLKMLGGYEKAQQEKYLSGDVVGWPEKK